MLRTMPGLAVCLVVALATRGAPGQDRPQPGRLVARTQWTRLEVVAGRIKIVPPRLGQRATLRADQPETGLRESLTLLGDAPTALALRYEFDDRQQHVLVEAEHEERVSLERTPVNESGLASVKYFQRPGEDVRLTVVAGEETLDRRAPSFWHLLIDAPDAAYRHLLPLLEGFRPGWRLEAQARQVEESLLAIARSARMPDTERIQQLLRDLDAPDFQTRQRADRELRDLGPAVLAYVERLDLGQLGAERRTRITRIRQTLAGADSDTPSRVALRLAGDPVVWLALLDREDVEKRLLASQRLALLAGHPVDFDPRAPAAQRRAERQRLEVELGLHRQVLIGERSGETRRR